MRARAALILLMVLAVAQILVALQRARRYASPPTLYTAAASPVSAPSAVGLTANTAFSTPLQPVTLLPPLAADNQPVETPTADGVFRLTLSDLGLVPSHLLLEGSALVELRLLNKSRASASFALLDSNGDPFAWGNPVGPGQEGSIVVRPPRGRYFVAIQASMHRAQLDVR